MIFVLVLAGQNAFAEGLGGRLSAGISGLRSMNGKVECLLFDSENGFPTKPSLAKQSQWCPITSGKTATCQFDGVVQGSYAVACIHDENDNGKLDTKLFGIPAEGVGVSNDAKGSFGPPRFKDARFSFAGANAAIAIRINYF